MRVKCYIQFRCTLRAHQQRWWLHALCTVVRSARDPQGSVVSSPFVPPPHFSSQADVHHARQLCSFLLKMHVGLCSFLPLFVLAKVQQHINERHAFLRLKQCLRSFLQRCRTGRSTRPRASSSPTGTRASSRSISSFSSRTPSCRPRRPCRRRLLDAAAELAARGGSPGAVWRL